MVSTIEDDYKAVAAEFVEFDCRDDGRSSLTLSVLKRSNTDHTLASIEADTSANDMIVASYR
jgi:hypothetical protein